MSTIHAEGVYAPPRVDEPPAPPADEAAHFFPVSLVKLAVLNIASLGIYTVYWYYRHWKCEAARMNKPIRPFWRAVFYVFYTAPLFERIATTARERRFVVPWGHGSMAAAVIGTTIASRIADRMAMRADEMGAVDALGIVLLFVLTVLLCRVQSSANLVNGDPDGQLNAHFGVGNVVVVVLGGCLWLFSLLAWFEPAWLDGLLAG